MSALYRDLRHAARGLIRNSGFSAAAIVLLALGIGANVALFTLVDGLLLAPLPGLAEPERLVAVNSLRREAPDVSRKLTWGDYRDFAREGSIFTALASFAPLELTLTHDGPSERLDGLLVSESYFTVLGVEPHLGRLLGPGDDDALAVLSYRLWQSRFGGDSMIVGRAVVVNGVPLEVIGVTPPAFAGTDRLKSPALFLPLGSVRQVARGVYAEFYGGEDRSRHWLEAVGRLADGVTVERAGAGLRQAAARLAAAHPETNDGRTAELLPLRELVFGPGQRPTLARWGWLLFAATGTVLLIACVNLAGLLFARGLDRRREIAIRLSLGASRRRVLGALLAESLLLALLGGGAGLVLARLALPLLERLELPVEIAPFTLELDGRVIAVALLAAVLGTILAGLLPGLRATRAGLGSALHGAGRPPVPTRGLRPAARDLLTALQVALALVVLIGAGLFARTLTHLAAVDLGFDPTRVLSASLDLADAGYDGERLSGFYRRLVDRLERLPEIEKVGMAAALPVVGASMMVDLGFELEDGRPDTGDGPPTARHAMVGGDFFRVLGLAAVDGRIFTAADDPEAPPVVVINESLARRYWPGASPIGRRIRLLQTEEPFTIVGVVPDTVFARRRAGPAPVLYLALTQHQRSFIGGLLAPGMTLLLRTRDDPGTAVPVLRRAVQDLDPQLPLFDVAPLEERLYGALGAERQAAAIFGLFAALALAITLVGLYGALASAVIARRGEIGVRLALGATPADVTRMMLRAVLVTSALGVALGLAGAWGLGRLIENRLYGVAAADPATWLAAAFLVVVTAVAVAQLPARHAARVDPATVLREL